MRVAPGVDRYRSRRLIAPLEFRARCKELLYEVELHVGYGQGHGHPLEGFLFNTQVRWNAATRPLSGYFAELCQLHNVGAITIEGFERREGELRAALQQLAAQRRQLDAVLEAYRKAAKANSPSVEAHRHDAEQILERAAEIIRSLNEEP
ncbi:MAG: hypothetical protein J7M08_06760 [Planctomycetes bacterium]|nr:hypothetical protein [Planctomycetota bacterium]